MSDFSIPMDFMENYIFKTKPDYASVYLYTHKFFIEGKPLPSQEEIASALRMSKETVAAAFNFWQGKGFCIGKAIPPAFDKSAYSPTELTGDTSFAFLCKNAQQSLGKLLSSADSQTLFWIYDYLGFSPTVILMMINYAVSENKGKMRYIEKLAMSWADKGLFTPEAVEKHLAEVRAYRTYETKIKNKLGITGRELTPTEKQIVRAWEIEVKPTADELVSALEICVDRTGKISLKYINGILSKWRNPDNKKPVTNKGKYSNFSNRTDIDYEKIELDAIRKRIKKG